jgi:hydrogenase-4 membrane subunit HyfE
MLNRRPLTWGLILGTSSHLLAWLPIVISAMSEWDTGIIIGIGVLLVRVLSFFCLNLNIISEAKTWRQGLRFALGWLSVSIVLLIIEFALFTNSDILSLLDPHSSMFAGLAYVLFGLFVAIAVGIELLIAGIQILIRARRDHCRTTNTFVN